MSSHLYIYFFAWLQRPRGPRTVRLLSLTQHVAIEHLIYYVPRTVQGTGDTVWNKTLESLAHVQRTLQSNGGDRQ